MWTFWLGERPVAFLAPNTWKGHGLMANAVVRAYNGVLGPSPWSGISGAKPPPPEAEALLVFERSMEATNLPTLLTFGNAKKSGICVIFPKNHG